MPVAEALPKHDGTHEGGVGAARFGRRRTAAAMIVCAGLLLLVLFVRRAYINIELCEPLLALAQEQRKASSLIPATRGMILDVRGRVLAASEHVPDVFVDAAVIQDRRLVAETLAPRLNLSPQGILARIDSNPNSRFVVVAESVDAVTAEAVKALRLPGVGLAEHSIRKYPLHESMAHVLGFVGRDRKGLEGVELQFDGHLRGRDGSRQTITDARRRALGRFADDFTLPQDGGHLVLTIDAEVQRIVEAAIKDAATEVGAESSIGVVMHPRTGEVLAMACWPAFDPAEAHSVLPELRRNRALTDPAEPGSTFKPFIASGALDGGYVNTTEKIDCKNGKHYFGGRLITDTKPRGVLDLKGIIAKSSNIGMGLIADRMGNPALHGAVRSFKFGEATGIEFPGEAPGVVYSLPKWGKLTTQSVAIGYEVMVTPLQLARSFSAIVNDGMLVRPRLVKQLLSASGEMIQSFDEPELAGRAASAEVARWMRDEALVAVVHEGGGAKAQAERYTVLGKTGTAKLLSAETGHYEPGAYLGTFVGAAPASRPQLVALVMIRRPDASKAYYGGAVAAPAVARIFDQALSYLGVPPDRTDPQVIAQRTAAKH